MRQFSQLGARHRRQHLQNLRKVYQRDSLQIKVLTALTLRCPKESS